MNKLIIYTLFTFSAASLSQVLADEISDTIEEGATFYKDANYSEAVNSLNYAVQLINQKASEQLGQFLPKVPDGWDRSEAEFQSAGASLFGGGNSVTASYSKGEENIKVSITANSPALQSMLMLVNNPAFLGASGKKIERIGGQKAIVEMSDGSGSINVIVAGTALVALEGYSTNMESMKALAEAIDYKKLVALLMQ